MEAGISAARQSWYLPALKSTGILLPGSEVLRLILHCSPPRNNGLLLLRETLKFVMLGREVHDIIKADLNI